MAKKTVLPDGRVTPRFAGLVTFGRSPRLEEVAKEHAPVDWAIYGAPFDGGVTYHPGARFGPRAIREASQYLKSHHFEHDVTVTNVLSLADAGDAPVAPYSCEKNAARVAEFAGGIGEKSTRLLMLGGDHSTALANMRATARRFGEGLAVLHFDSHLDTLDAVWDEKYGHASPFIRAIEEGLIDAKAMLSVGIKGPLNDAKDLEFAKRHGVEIVPGSASMEAIGERIDAFRARIGDRPVYLSFDIDVVDPACAPGTGTYCPGGFTSRETLELLRRLAGFDIVGADVVEVLPDRDPQGITAFLAAHVAFEILALDAIRRVKGGRGASQ